MCAVSVGLMLRERRRGGGRDGRREGQREGRTGREQRREGDGGRGEGEGRRETGFMHTVCAEGYRDVCYGHWNIRMCTYENTSAFACGSVGCVCAE